MRVNECGHPDLPHVAKGKCKKCYDKQWCEENAEKKYAGEKARRAANPEARRRQEKNRYERKAKEICARQNAWRKANPLKRLNADLKCKYGITLDEYQRMLAAQGGVCAICKGTCPRKNRLAVDHDHSTGEVRGLLCDPCNSAIGIMEDSPERLRAAADYIEAAIARRKPDAA